jgi:hypothetical protein
MLSNGEIILVPAQRPVHAENGGGTAAGGDLRGVESVQGRTPPAEEENASQE